MVTMQYGSFLQYRKISQQKRDSTLQLLENFPPNLSPRNIQKEILEEVEQKIRSGYKKIIISAPTGAGKSAIGITLARYFENSFLVTASKNLQDQYIKDYPGLHPVKGKSNFSCLKLMEKEKLDDPVLATTMELTCEKGRCEEEKVGSKPVYCKFKPDIKEIAAGNIPSYMCHYYIQKYVALASDHSLWNYHSFFQLMLNRKAFAEYVGKKIAVFDEAHKIEDQIINFIGIKITSRQLEECNIDISRYDINNIDDVLELLDAMRKSYAEMLQKMDEQKDYDPKIYTRYQDQLERAARLHGNISDDKENFVINDPQKDIDDNIEFFEIKPIVISNFVQNFFETEYQVFMSATIDKKSFCETMGFDESSVAFIDTPKSPFPLENRRVEFLDTTKVNKNSSFEDRLKIVKQIDDLLDIHSQERGLILTSSISNCNFIRKYLSEKNQKRIRICHSFNPDKKTQEQILNEHQNDPTSVLLSSSLWEGVDLKDDLSRFQIVAKIPYPPLTEKRTVAKMKRFPLWYDSQTLMKLLQGLGRSIRSEKDYAKTYVLDSAIHFLLSKTRNILPKAYYDTLNISLENY